MSAFAVYQKKKKKSEREMCKQYSSVIIADRKTGINLQSCTPCGSSIDLVLTLSKQKKLKSMFFEHPQSCPLTKDI